MTSATVAAARRRGAVRRRPLRLPRVGLHVFLVATAIVWLAPVAWAVFTSFRPYSDTAEHGYVGWPHALSFVNYRNAWSQGEIPLHFWNSMIITPLYELYLRIPLPTWLSSSGLVYDSFIGVIAVNVAFQTGFCTFVLSNYMKTIPRSLSEAARVDGAGVARQFVGIILPLCRPAMAALATLEFTWIYNDFLWAIVLMSSGDKRPITSSLTNLQGTFFTDNNLIAAASVLVALPTLIVFAALQRQFINGLTLGATKE